MSYTKPLIIALDSIDSTNNYAMSLINGNTAQAGMTIVAQNQNNGKGQRGKTWVGAAGESLLLSVIIAPEHSLSAQFLFNASVSIAIANVLRKLYKGYTVAIKWPNDIMINDKKAGGILIENVIRGNVWTYSIVGLGLNVNQITFPTELPYATSLKIATGNDYLVSTLAADISQEIITATAHPLPENTQMQLFNSYLHRRGKQQLFSDDIHQWAATILNAMSDGTLQVQLADGAIVNYVHGSVIMSYEPA